MTDPITTREDVEGYCPSCGHASLFLADGGFVTCRIRECRNPTAASDLLDDREIHHIVELHDGTFTIRHPLIERLGDALMDCDLHEFLAGLAGPPRKPGRYRVTLSDDGNRWSFHEIGDEP